MNNLTDLPSIFCSTPLFIEITKNSSISESLSECMGLVALPAIPTFLAIISVIFLLIYGKIFCRECQPLKMSNKVSFTKMALSIICGVLSLFECLMVWVMFDVSDQEFFIYPILHLIFSIFCIMSYLICIKNGIVSSGLLLLCWVLQFLSTIPGLVIWSRTFFNVPVYNPKIFGLMVWLIVGFVQIILFFIADQQVDESNADINCKDGTIKLVDPELKSSAISRLFYSYISNLIRKGFKKSLENSDFYGLDVRNTAQDLTQRFEKDLTHRFEKILKNNGREKRREWIPWILWPLLKVAREKMAKSILLSLIQTPLMLISPFFLSWIVNSVMDEDPFWYICSLAFAMCIFNTFAWVLLEKVEFYGIQALSNMKTVLMYAIYEKELKLSYASRAEYSTGKLINLITTDSQQRLGKAIWRAHGFVTYPLTIVWCFIQLFLFIGHSAWFGLIVMVAILLFNSGIQRINLKYENIQMEQKDQRLKLSVELLKGFKILKLYAWEMPFLKKISSCREKELRAVRAVNIIQMGVVESSFYISAVGATIVTLLSYSSIEGHSLTPQIAFATLMLFVYMKNALLLFPELINEAMKSFISLRRISDYLDAEELSKNEISNEREAGKLSKNKISNKRDEEGHVIVIQNGHFELKNASSKQIIQLGDLKIQKGKLVGIVGAVGSGKSAFLSILKNEWPVKSGHVQVIASELADVPQMPWIQNKTLRDNICFQKEYDEVFFNEVIYACCLHEDLKTLIAGDMTEIGERGINLSGGQRARVALARAVYQQAEVYLIDDTLSAVDAHVGRHIFEKVLGPKGLLKNATRIFALNSVQYLSEFDQIIEMEATTSQEVMPQQVIMNDLLLNENGSEKTYKSSSQRKTRNGISQKIRNIEMVIDARNGNNHVTNALLSDEKTQNIQNGKLTQEIEWIKIGECKIKEIKSRSDNENGFLEYVQKYALQSEIKSSRKETLTHQVVEKENSQESGNLIEEEFVEEGHASWRVYMTYFNYFGIWLLISYLVLLYIFTAASEGFSNIWLAQWASNEIHGNFTAGDKLLVFSMFNGIACVCITICGAIFAFGGSRASKKLHEDFMKSILHSPMAFFDRTPLGRIYNRLSTDITRIDTDLAYQIAFLGILTRYVFQCIITIVIYIPILIIFAIGLVMFFALLIWFYTKTSIQIRRLLSKSMSLLSSYVEDSYAGASSIRTYQVVKPYQDRMKEIIDSIIEIELSENVVNRWINVRLTIVTQTVVFMFVSVAIYMADYNLISLGILAMIITNGATFANELSYVAKACRDIEMHVVAVERMKEYIDNEPEAPWKNDENDLDESQWPSKGTIEFKNLSLSYVKDGELVLKNLNFKVEGGKKLGIVGRTGAGKSSITMALFRVVEPAAGQILIDGVDISHLGLHSLREALTIIPQEPVLFSGTLRSNLDPENKYDDAEIWYALEVVQLKDFMEAKKDKLNFEINEGGENLSAGQRQLICLARAILRKNTKILILDEAAASLDVNTDQCIQKAIREDFKDCTVLTIAHRINTIMDYDMILTMDQGEAKELDTPTNLCNNPESLFCKLVNESRIRVASGSNVD